MKLFSLLKTIKPEEFFNAIKKPHFGDMAENNKNFKMSAKRACGDKPDIVKLVLL